jgi:hypothetical protein
VNRFCDFCTNRQNLNFHRIPAWPPSARRAVRPSSVFERCLPLHWQCLATRDVANPVEHMAIDPLSPSSSAASSSASSSSSASAAVASSSPPRSVSFSSHAQSPLALASNGGSGSSSVPPSASLSPPQQHQQMLPPPLQRRKSVADAVAVWGQSIYQDIFIAVRGFVRADAFVTLPPTSHRVANRVQSHSGSAFTIHSPAIRSLPFCAIPPWRPSSLPPF